MPLTPHALRLVPAALSAALLCAALPACAAAPAPTAAAPFKVKVIGFNDYHGQLQSPGTFGEHTAIPAAQRPAVGGAEYLAAYVARMKAANPLNVVVGAGDFIGTTPLISALFHDEPVVETLNRIGVDFNAVGNHEFDKGAAELLRLQRGGCKTDAAGRPDPHSCRGLGSAAPGSFDGARFKWLSANVVERTSGRTLLPAYGVKTFNGVEVAFIGMTLRDTPGIVSPAGVAGLVFRDEADDLTGLQLRNLLEQQFRGCQGQTADRVLQVSVGFTYTWDAAAAPCARVREVRFTPMELSGALPVPTGAEQVIVAQGVVLDPARTWRVTVNNFIQGGGDGFTVLTGGTRVLGGGQDIDALTAYLARFKAPAAPFDPAHAAYRLPRITRIGGAP